MIELKFWLILVGVLLVCSCDPAQCSNNFNAPKRNRVLDCKRLCRDSTPTENPVEDSKQSKPSCVEKCLLSAEENASATTLPTSELPSVITPSATELSKFACPTSYGPGPGEVIPGEVSDVAVAFVQKKKENGQEWVARVNWTAPKYVNFSSNWRGYVAIWFSENSESDIEKAGRANCKLLPKNQPHLEINDTDGWKYPDSIYITIVALPTEREAFTMKDYDPRGKDWRSSGRYAPTITLKGHKRFRLTPAEKAVLLIVSGLVLGFAMMWMVHVWVLKRKTFPTYKVALTVEKKGGKKADEMKDQLIA